MVRIEEAIEINAPIERVFDAERDISLHTATQSERGEKAIAGVTSGLIELGQEVEWEAKHFGFRQRLRVRITQMEKPFYFRDEMIRGAFKSMSHEHIFTKTSQNSTTKRDVFCFSAPLGVLGYFAELLFLRHYMTRFLRDKNLELKRLIESQA